MSKRLDTGKVAPKKSTVYVGTHVFTVVYMSFGCKHRNNIEHNFDIQETPGVNLNYMIRFTFLSSGF